MLLAVSWRSVAQKHGCTRSEMESHTCSSSVNCLMIHTGAKIQKVLKYHSVLSDFTGFTVAARRLRKVTTATVTPNTATNATANTQMCSGT